LQVAQWHAGVVAAPERVVRHNKSRECDGLLDRPWRHIPRLSIGGRSALVHRDADARAHARHGTARHGTARHTSHAHLSRRCARAATARIRRRSRRCPSRCARRARPLRRVARRAGRSQAAGAASAAAADAPTPPCGTRT
jgi:hypothetical protein